MLLNSKLITTFAIAASPMIGFAGQDMESLTDRINKYWYPAIGAIIDASHGEIGKLGPFSLGQLVQIDSGGKIRDLPNAKCRTGETEDDQKNIDNISPDLVNKYLAKNALLDIFCSSSILGGDRRFRLLLARTSPSGLDDKYNYLIAEIRLQLTSPDKETLDLLGEAIAKRWGLPASRHNVDERKRRVEEIAAVCESEVGPLGTLKERMAKEDCRARLSSNPLVQMIASVGKVDTVEYFKNGVHVELSSHELSLPIARGMLYELSIMGDEIIPLVEKIRMLKEEDAIRVKKEDQAKKLVTF